ncbi:MAG: PqqD family peptide modification chaperone [Planctomycetota bacterium]
MPKLFDPNRGPAGQTFSDVWFQVADTKPRLSPHARFIRQNQGPTVRFVVEDPAGGAFYRLSESARFFVGMLDGRRTAEDAWRACLAQLGDEAPTQRECLDLLAQLQLFGLLVGDQPLAPDMIGQRQERFRSQRLKQRTGNWLFYNIPIFNPEPWLHALRRPLEIVWGWPGLIALIALGGVAAFELVTNLDRLAGSLNNVLNPTNLFWLGAIFLAIRLLHELGHATACKAMGGRCTEIGVMLIAMILPLPYCDASSSWRFPDTWRRVVVALGGILIELALAGVAVIIWAHSEPGLARTLAFNVMIISGVTTFLFNLNPLLRYDGYYILSDLAGSPNLASRSKDLWKHAVLTKLFGVVGSKPPPVRDAGEARFLFAFHALAIPYRLTVLVAILILILGQYLSLGIILAVIFAAVWLVLPIVGGAWFLLTSPQLVGRRARAIAATLAIVGPLVAIVGFVPLPASARVPAVVDWADLETLRAGEAGYLREIRVAPGERAAPGETVFVLDNPTLVADRDRARVRVRRAEAMVDAAAAEAPAMRRVARSHRALALDECDELERRAAALEVTASSPGVIVTPRTSAHELEQSVNRYVRKGEVLAYVLPDTGPTLLAAVTDSLAPRVIPRLAPGSSEATVRLRGAAGTEIDAVVTRVWPAGSRELPTTALAASTGGDILQDPTDPRRAISPVTQIELTPEPHDALIQGRRGRARIELPPEPIATRVIRHFRSLIDARLGR